MLESAAEGIGSRGIVVQGFSLHPWQLDEACWKTPPWRAIVPYRLSRQGYMWLEPKSRAV